MKHVASGYQGLGLLFDINNDRMLSILIIAAAMAAVGWVGVEYTHSVIVQDYAVSGPTYL